MRRVALIGSPLKRRHSEVMHNAAFERWTGVSGAGETMAIAVRPLLEAGGDA